MRPESSFERVGGVRMHAVHAGAGPSVVLLHGLSGSHRWWRYSFPALARSYRVHAPELIGFGASRPVARAPDIPELAAILMEWMDAYDIEATHRVGHSMGAQISIHIAAKRPARIQRLVLADAAGIPRRFRLLDAVRLIVDTIPPRAWGRPSFLPTIARDAVRAGPRRLLRTFAHLLADDVRPLLPRIRSTTLLVWGEYDPLVPLDHGRRMERAIPDARLIVIDGAAHNPMADKPGAFNRALLSFLAGE